MSSHLRQQPHKLFYRIGEVSRLTGLEPYILRYWETEFPLINPGKSKKGQRLYQRSDIDAILLVKQLLYKDGYTIAGAKKRLQGNKGGTRADAIEAVKKELKEILDILK